MLLALDISLPKAAYGHPDIRDIRFVLHTRVGSETTGLPLYPHQGGDRIFLKSVTGFLMR